MSIFSAMCKLHCICNPFNVNNLYTRNFITLWIQDVKYWELEVFIVVDPSKYYQDHSYFCWFNALGVYLIKLQKSLKIFKKYLVFPFYWSESGLANLFTSSKLMQDWPLCLEEGGGLTKEGTRLSSYLDSILCSYNSWYIPVCIYTWFWKYSLCFHCIARDNLHVWINGEPVETTVM